MKPIINTFTNCFGDRCYNEINEHGYPTTWDMHSIMATHVSVFDPPIRNTVKFRDLNLLLVYRLITTSRPFAAHTQKLRSLPKPEAKKYKDNHFYYACFSGTFHKRCAAGLRQPSGLICLDMDHLGDKLTTINKAVNALPQTVMSFISPSGDGLKVLFRFKEAGLSHGQYYEQCAQFLIDTCNVPSTAIDPNCKDISRPCYLPYDPNCYLNPKLGLQ